MFRTILALLCLLTVVVAPTRADVFDRYTNPILGKAPGADGVVEIPKLTPEFVSKHSKLLGESGNILLIVKGNAGLNSKLAVQFAQQRAGDGAVPIALVDRFQTYKQNDAIQVTGRSTHLYDGFRLNLEIGQVVPAELGGDVKFVAKGDEGHLEPVGKAKLYLVTKHLPGTEPKKGEKVEIGDEFEPRFFAGTYKLVDDGRRSAKLTLKVDPEGEVTGDYLSEQSGVRYEVTGKVSANPKHLVEFTVKFPQSKQTFKGWMFTRDGKAICGTTRLQEHEFGFYALRVEEE